MLAEFTKKKKNNSMTPWDDDFRVTGCPCESEQLEKAGRREPGRQGNMQVCKLSLLHECLAWQGIKPEDKRPEGALWTALTYSELIDEGWRKMTEYSCYMRYFSYQWTKMRKLAPRFLSLFSVSNFRIAPKGYSRDHTFQFKIYKTSKRSWRVIRL